MFCLEHAFMALPPILPIFRNQLFDSFRGITLPSTFREKKKKRESIISPTFLFLHPFDITCRIFQFIILYHLCSIHYIPFSILSFSVSQKSLPQFLEIKIRVPEPNQADVLGSLHVKIPTESDQSAAISIRECQQSLPNPDS